MKKNKLKKVLIALDYDPSAMKVVDVGYSMAKAMGAEVILIHVVVDLVAYSLSYLNMGPLQLESDAGIKDASEVFMEKMKLRLNDPLLKSVIKQGDFAACILEAVHEEDIDIIVMGTHSKRWLEDIVMGNVTEQVIRKATIPMFIVPTKKRG